MTARAPTLGDLAHDRLLGRAGKDSLVDNRGDNVMIGARRWPTRSSRCRPTRRPVVLARSGRPGGRLLLIRNRRRDRASGGAGRDSAFADQSDVLRSIEDSLTRSPRIPGLPRF